MRQPRNLFPRSARAALCRSCQSYGGDRRSMFLLNWSKNLPAIHLMGYFRAASGFRIRAEPCGRIKKSASDLLRLREQDATGFQDPTKLFDEKSQAGSRALFHMYRAVTLGNMISVADTPTRSCGPASDQRKPAAPGLRAPAMDSYEVRCKLSCVVRFRAALVE